MEHGDELPAGFRVDAAHGGGATQNTEVAATVVDCPPPDKGCNLNWQIKDFFLLSETEEVSLKKQIAMKLGIHYGNANQDKPFADDYGGLKAYTVDGVTTAREAFRAKLHDSSLTGPARATALADSCHQSMVVSGCLIKWKPVQVVNEGYVEDWMRKNVTTGKWDSSVERRAALANDVESLVLHGAPITTQIVMFVLRARCCNRKPSYY